MTWIRTYSGSDFDFNKLNVDVISIEDIAHALSNTCRFGGHCHSFYSVAEHSVLICRWLAECGFDYTVQLAGLMHDASEAVLGDVPGPLKKLLPGYIEIEKKTQIAMAGKFNFMFPLPPEVKFADQMLLTTEAKELMSLGVDGWEAVVVPSSDNIYIHTWEPYIAKQMFLEEWRRLQKAKKFRRTEYLDKLG